MTQNKDTLIKIQVVLYINAIVLFIACIYFLSHTLLGYTALSDFFNNIFFFIQLSEILLAKFIPTIFLQTIFTFILLMIPSVVMYYISYVTIVKLLQINGR